MLSSYNSNTDSSLDTVKLLLENSANINVQNKDGSTALILVSQCLSESNNFEIISLLLQNDANIHMYDNNKKTYRDHLFNNYTIII